jgi:hypothetical protein
MLRDGMMSRLVSETGVDLQAYKAAILFLNGQYWGICNLREKVSKHFIASHHGVEIDDVDLLYGPGDVVDGDNSDYLALVDFLESHDLTESSNYDYVESRVDVDEFANYITAQVYFGNVDWPGLNIKQWKANSKWRWILYDTDYGYCLAPQTACAEHNTLEYTLDPDGIWEWPCPNPPWSTVFIRSLTVNADFRHHFINRYCVLRATLFRPDLVHLHIDSLSARIAHEMPRQIERWGGSLSQWNENIEELREFASSRLSYLDEYYRAQFDLDGGSSLSVDVENAVGGQVTIDGYPLKTYPVSIDFFDGVPIVIEAHPDPGWEFLEWVGAGTSAEITITMTEDLDLHARFIEVVTSQPVVISEINYNSADDFDPGDWLEITNNTAIPMDVSHWRFKDSDVGHFFELPANTLLQPEGSLVFCSDQAAFQSLFPEVSNTYGDFNFGLSGSGELIRLYDDEAVLMDSLVYDDHDPWPEEPDGDGPTLQLIDLDSDNSLAQSWVASEGHGSPGYFEVGVDPMRPIAFKLYQNAPNPFNPTTRISYELPHAGWLEVFVYNLLGEELQVLGRQQQGAGSHSLTFNAQGLASGMYFYSLHLNGERLATKRMPLMQ